MTSVSNRGPLAESWRHEVEASLASLVTPWDAGEIRAMDPPNDPGKSRALRVGERLLRLSESVWRSGVVDRGNGRFHILPAETGEAELFEVTRHFALTIIGDTDDYHAMPGWPVDIYNQVSDRHAIANAMHRLIPDQLPLTRDSDIRAGIEGWDAVWALLRSQKIREGEIVPLVKWPSPISELDRLIGVLVNHRASHASTSSRPSARRPGRRLADRPSYEAAQRLYWQQRDKFEERGDKPRTDEEFRKFLAEHGYHLGENTWNGLKREWREADASITPWPPIRPSE